MTLTELKYVVAVARERHFGHAAERCHVTQPTLSVGVRRIEAELGLALFERDRGEVLVTPAGQRIIEQAQRVLEEAERLQELARGSQDQLDGPLRVGAIYTAGPYIIPNVIPRLRKLAPRMPLIVEENFTHRLGEHLRSGDLDVIIVALPFAAPGIETLPVYDEPFMVLLPAGHPWQDRDAIAPGELGDDNLLMLGPGHCFRDQVLESCPGCLDSEAAQRLQQTVAAGSLETIRQMVASGLGITVVPATSTVFMPGQKKLYALKPFKGRRKPSRTIALAWRSSFPRPEAVRILAQALREANLHGVHYLGRFDSI